MRRAPAQSRSRARVEAILDAADAVFLEMGYAAATTNHVAERAGTSIGSLYRFFPDKEALLVALAERYGQRMAALGAEVSPIRAGTTLREQVAFGVRAFNALLVAWPGFRTLLAEANHPALAAGRARQDAEMIALLRASLRELGRDDAAVMATVTNTVLGALQGLSLTGDERFREAVVEEAIAMVVAYLASRLGVDPDAPLPAVPAG